MGALLKNLNVIITRPQDQAIALSDKITSQQGIATIFPTLAITKFPDCSARVEALLKNNHFDFIIFNSRNAVIPIQSVIATIKDSKILAMGPSTERALQQCGARVDSRPYEKFDSEHLLELLTLEDIAGKKILLLAGEGGRNFLEQGLMAKGAQVTKCAVYKRILPKISEKAAQQVVQLQNGIMVSTSGENLNNLFVVMRRYRLLEWLFKMPVLVVSNRMKDAASELGFKEEFLVLANNATDDAILECLIKWYSTPFKKE